MHRHARTMAVVATLGLALGLGAAAEAGTLWGVSHAHSGFWQGGSIWTMDTTTQATAIQATYDAGTLLAFGDIAVSPSCDVYVTMHNYGGVFDFKTLAKVNTTTWGFDWTQTLPEQVNALTFVGDTLYAAAGGGAVDNLYRFDTLDGVTAPTLVGPSGYLGSDGDLFVAPTGKLYNVYTPGSVGNLVEVNPTTGAGTPVGTIDGTAKFGDTLGGFQYGWSGMDFDDTGKLWAGNFWDQALWSRPTLNPSDNVVYELDLGAQGIGSVTGLSFQAGCPVPEPVTLLGLAAGLGGLARYVRRRRRA